MTDTSDITFLLMEGYRDSTIVSAIEVLQEANSLLGARAYQWSLCQLEGCPVENGGWDHKAAVVTKESLANGKSSFVFVAAGADACRSSRAVSMLRYLFTHGVTLVGLDSAGLALAATGLIDGRKATVHWSEQLMAQNMFPDVNWSNRLFEIDGRIMTCAGRGATVDLLFHLIEKRHGHDLVRQVAGILQRERIRGEKDEQAGVSAILDHRLDHALKIMRNSLDLPISLDEIAREVGYSRRHLERVFKDRMKLPPNQYYKQLRLSHAQKMLQCTSKSILHIALDCGFQTASHFTKCYRGFFGVVPSQHRKNRPVQVPLDKCM